MGLHTSQIKTHIKKLYICVCLYMYIYKENLCYMLKKKKSPSKISCESPTELQALLEGFQKTWLAKRQCTQGKEQVVTQLQAFWRYVIWEPEMKASNPYLREIRYPRIAPQK